VSRWSVKSVCVKSVCVKMACRHDNAWVPESFWSDSVAGPATRRPRPAARDPRPATRDPKCAW
jgi:hypothetical protein